MRWLIDTVRFGICRTDDWDVERWVTVADPTRRYLLDLLFKRDGRTLTELESELAMTRFGVMKHLRVLERAGVVVTRWAGREKLHFLNPVPIRLIHDRWIDKYTERHVSALLDLKTELEAKAWRQSRKPSIATTAGVRGLHQGLATGDLGRHHVAGMDGEVRLPGRRRIRAASGRRVPGSRDARDAGVGYAGRRRRRRGRAGRSAEGAGAHLPLPVQRRQRRPRASRASRGRSKRSRPASRGSP